MFSKFDTHVSNIYEGRIIQLKIEHNARFEAFMAVKMSFGL